MAGELVVVTGIFHVVIDGDGGDVVGEVAAGRTVGPFRRVAGPVRAREVAQLALGLHHQGCGERLAVERRVHRDRGEPVHRPVEVHRRGGGIDRRL